MQTRLHYLALATLVFLPSIHAQTPPAQVQAYNSSGSSSAVDASGSPAGPNDPPRPPVPPTPPFPIETFEAAFEIQSGGKQVKNSCATCHHLTVSIDGKQYASGEIAMLQKGKSYEVRVQDKPESTRPASSEPAHDDTAKFTIWPMPVNGQTLTQSPEPSNEPDLFVISKDDMIQYIIGNDEKLLVRDKAWPKDPKDEPMNKKASIVPVKVVELSPKVKDENGNDIADSEKPSIDTPLTPFVEINSANDKIAHRELKVRIGESLKGKTVTWTYDVVPGAKPATIRGHVPATAENPSTTRNFSKTHPNRFEASAAYGSYEFTPISQVSGRTKVAEDGFTAIRVNVPPIGFNQVRIKIQIQGIATPYDLIDMEVPAVVVIDPGHGGVDSGAEGRTDTSVKEAAMTLDYGVGLKTTVLNYFSAQHRNLRLLIIRTGDEYVARSDRAFVAKDNGADIFLSIHFNSSEPVNGVYARGTEYCSRLQGQVNKGEDDLLGSNVQKTTLAAVKAVDPNGRHRDPKEAQYEVVSDEHYGNTAAFHPIRGTIIEVEFLSNVDSLAAVRLSNPSGVAIKSEFQKNIPAVLFNNILNQP